MAFPLRISVHKHSNFHVFEVQGDLIGAGSKALLESVTKSLSADPCAVLVSLKKMRYLDEEAFEILLSCRRNVLDHGGRFAIALHQPRPIDWPLEWPCQAFMDEAAAREYLINDTSTARQASKPRSS